MINEVSRRKSTAKAKLIEKNKKRVSKEYNSIRANRKSKIRVAQNSEEPANFSKPNSVCQNQIEGINT